MLTQLAINNIKPGPARREIPDGKKSGLYLVVQPQPSDSVSWAFRYRFEGKSRKLTIGAYLDVTLRQARDKAAKARAAIADGRDPAAEKQAKKATRQTNDRGLVEKIAQQFIERYAKPNQRPETCRETERILNREIVQPWKGRRLSEITKADIHDLLDAIVHRGSPIQANRTLAAFRKMCAWAIERGLIHASPCAGIRAPAAETSRDRYLADDELAAVWKACDGLGWPFAQFVRLLILTGQRRSEVAEMRWSEIDLDNKVWLLPKERAKNNVAHAVPLSEAAVAILKELPHVAGKGLVFTTTGETSVAGFSRAKERLDAALPPDMPAWTLHDLRRTFASGCARFGIAVHVVEAALNHKSGTIKGVAAVYNRYSYDAEKRAALDAWARYVETIVRGQPSGNVIELAAAKG
jgi:integrase